MLPCPPTSRPSPTIRPDWRARAVRFIRATLAGFLSGRAWVESGSDRPSGETANMPRTAKYLCGAFSVAVSAEPTMVNVCHCRDCQRRSGVPWTSNAYFPREAVSLDGPNNIYTRTSNACRPPRLRSALAGCRAFQLGTLGRSECQQGGLSAPIAKCSCASSAS